MKRDKLKFQIVLVVLLCLILSACSKNSTNAPSTTYTSNVSQSIATDATTEAPTETTTPAPAPEASPEATTTTSTPEAIEATKPTQSPDVQTSAPSEEDTKDTAAAATVVATPVTGTLKISYIDVGQADSILIQNGSSSMLIDAGNNGDADTVVGYIKQQGISKLDYIVGTHPHEDHIGGMDAVINTFDIGKILMPQTTTTTKTFEDAITAIKNKSMKITTPVPGSTFDLGSAKCTIFAPNSSKYENLNDYSIVIKLTFGKTSFLFTGDAESVSEQEMMSKDFDLRADVLKIGHHGSDSSTTKEFLKAVSPKYAVISAGRDNSYGHPTQTTLERLSNSEIQVFRTDESGTIIVTSDGETIKFDKKASAIKPQAPPAASSSSESKSTETVTTDNAADNVKDITVYITKSGGKYHADGCRYLSKSKIPISLSEAKGEGYTPCKVCKPTK